MAVKMLMPCMCETLNLMSSPEKNRQPQKTQNSFLLCILYAKDGSETFEK